VQQQTVNFLVKPCRSLSLRLQVHGTQKDNHFSNVYAKSKQYRTSSNALKSYSRRHMNVGTTLLRRCFTYQESLQRP